MLLLVGLVLGSLLGPRQVCGQQQQQQQQQQQSPSLFASIPFNLDLRFPISLPTETLRNELQTRNTNQPTLFGSSIVATPEKIKRIRRQNVFIGSPSLRSKVNSSLITGSVFKCSLDATADNLNPKCEEIQLKNDDTRSLYADNKTKSLVGFTLGRTATEVIACAPNYVGANETPEGLCFMLGAETGAPLAAFKYDRVRPIEHNRPYDSHNLLGFSYAYNHMVDEIILGMPGHVDFTGTVVTVSSSDLNARIVTTSVGRGARTLVNTYFSYALAFSAFANDDMQAIIASWPKFNKFNGKVDLIDYSTGTTVHSLHGRNDSVGEYFGASLLVADVNKDERGDLFVGAPLFSFHNRRELGRVYWFRSLSSRDIRRNQPQVIMAKSPRAAARFGTSMASIDLNDDSFQDVIISAPFEENLSSSQSTGAIYIYYGFSDGLHIHREKRIEASELSSASTNNLLGFGYALWTINDIDNNGYRDLIVGSLISEHVSVLRTIPITRLNLTLEFDRKGINFSDHSSCPTNQLAVSSCFRVGFCIITDLAEAQQLKQDATYRVELSVTDRKLRLKESRVKLAKQVVRVKSRGNRICHDINTEGFVVVVKDKEEISDIITPIEVRLEASLENQNHDGKKFCAHCPIASPVSIFREIGFEHGCAKKVCEAHLSLNVTMRYGPNVLGERLVQGLYDSIDVPVRVTNRGESSIDTLLVVQMRPTVLQLIDNVDARRCRLDTRLQQYLCDVNRLLQTNQTEEMLLRLDTSEIVAKSLTIHFQLQSSSVIKDTSLISQELTTQVTKEASFDLDHSTFFQNESFSDQTQRKLFQLTYIVNKRGPSVVNGTQLQLYMPSNVVDIDQSYPFKCFRVGFAKARLSTSYMINETLTVNCDVDGEACSKYECNLPRFPSRYKSVSLDLTLAFHPRRISSQLKYEHFAFTIKSYLSTADQLIGDALLAASQTEFRFEKQSTLLKSKASPLIMFGGAGVGLFLLLITTIVLIKRGFFRRKRREELLRMKQRISMNPNMFANVNIET